MPPMSLSMPRAADDVVRTLVAGQLVVVGTPDDEVVVVTAREPCRRRGRR